MTAAVFGAAGYIASLGDGLRKPAQETVSVPEVATVPPDPAKPTTAQAKPATPDKTTGDGPSIIRLGPETAPTGNIIVIRDPSALANNLRTAHVPVRDLIEQSETGPLPIRAADGRRPFDAYAGAWSGSRGAKVAIVIGGLGLSQTGT
ncbi:MAG: divergent polysaccharide deacetylase family protein, partial [Mesorhizobium sp.]|nr:divergent polysaccharide deacetylase family protein [Mesorhizobium sp.]